MGKVIISILIDKSWFCLLHERHVEHTKTLKQ